MFSVDVFEEIKKRLTENNIPFSEMRHEPVFTSEQAAEVRGVGLESGAKAIVMRSEGKFYMFVISASKKIDSKKVKKILKTKSLSFASSDEVFDVCHCKSGAVPPFGDMFGMQVFVDRSLLGQKEINFNAGRRDRSLQMKIIDYLKVTKHIVEDFSL